MATTVSMSSFSDSINTALAPLSMTQTNTQSPQEVALQLEREEKAAKIDAYLLKNKMPLAGNGMKMVLAAEKYELDWRMIPAIAVRESTGGRFACKKFPENAWGWHSCKAGLGGSTDAAIDLIAQHLSGNNPNTARYYSTKTTPKEILQTYNPPSVVPTYAAEVMSVMAKIESINV